MYFLMNNFLDFYQHIPEKINPEIFSLGFFSLGWYALMYLVGFGVVFLLLRKRLKLGEGKMSFEQLFDFLLFCFLGALLGGRLGYVFFYNYSFYFAHPLAIISPFDAVSGELIGIYGMSYHGGLAGVIFVALFFAKKYGLNFWTLSDFVVPAIPAGYFFGRIGNFLNGELFGRVTNSMFGMYFPFSGETQNFTYLLFRQASLQLRHPSQLYEALLEGVLLFLIFWKIRNRKELQGNFLALYFIGYAVMRFLGEFFREPDVQIGLILGGITLGQLFSLGMFFSGLAVLFVRKKTVL